MRSSPKHSLYLKGFALRGTSAAGPPLPMLIQAALDVITGSIELGDSDQGRNWLHTEASPRRMHFGNLLEQSSLLQVILVDHRCRLGKLISLLQESLDVFANEVRFEIHGVVHLLET
jgi:hypothetical protein